MKAVWRVRRGLLWSGLWVPFFCAGCLSPAYDTITATSVARDPMRKAVTDNVELYYPAGHQAAAQRSLGHLNRCLNVLHEHLVDEDAPDAAVVVLHRGEQNNAYVQPALGGTPMHMVLPVHEGLEMFNLLNFGLLEVPEVSCHEAVHYVTFQQTHGFWAGFNFIFGDVVANNAFLDAWFHEGMATYYESRLSPGVGRPASLLWQGMFASGVAGRDYQLHAADLNVATRELGAFGAHYLIGNHFIEYLAQTYGEEKLWELIDTQGRSFFSPFGVTLRFWQVYGKDISGLFNEFVAALPARVPRRAPPTTQAELKPPMGYWARMASCPAQQRVAVAHMGTDQVPILQVWNADGSEQFSRRLIDILPGRDRITGSIQGVSGLSFSSDCSRLFFHFADLGVDTAYSTSLFELDGHDGARVGHWQGMNGVGGNLHPDGKRYAYVRLVDDTASLTLHHLETNEEVVLPPVPGVTTVATPAFSADGQALAFAARTPAGFNLFLRRGPDGAYEQLTDDDAFNYAPRWLDAGHLLFTRGHEGRLQAFTYEVASRTMTPVTDAPYALLDPAPLGDGRVVFLNAQGWEWSLATAPLGAGGGAGAADAGSGSAAGAGVGAAAGPSAPSGAAGDDAAAREAHAAAQEPAPPEVYSDEPYSGGDHLGIPIFRAPWIAMAQSSADPNRLGVSVQAEVVGYDRLGWHGYSLAVGYNPFALLPNVSAQYLNRQLAPWSLSAQFAFLPSEFDRRFYGVLSASRPFWSNNLGLNLKVFDGGPNPQYPDRSLSNYRLVGPGVNLSYAATESTPYGGYKRAFAANAAASVYPFALGSTANIGDLSATLFGALPLPLSLRHQLTVQVHGRAIVGAPERVLRTGGIGSGTQLAASSLTQGTPGKTLDYYNSNLGLSESVRGYEDFGWLANNTVSGLLTYTYPIIFDWGWHSLLWIFPSFFISEVDLQLFGSSAFSTAAPHRPQWHSAVGGQVTLETWVGRFYNPSLIYQVAYRFDETFPKVRHSLVLSFN